jgi:hypothetical protein
VNLRLLPLLLAAACTPERAAPPAAAPRAVAPEAHVAKLSWTYYTGRVGGRYREVAVRVPSAFTEGELHASYALDLGLGAVSLLGRFENGELVLEERGTLRFRIRSATRAPAQHLEGTFFPPLSGASAELEVAFDAAREEQYRALVSAPPPTREIEILKALAYGAVPHRFRVVEDPFEEVMRADIADPNGKPIQSITWSAPTCAKCGRVGASEETLRFIDFDFDGHLDLLLLRYANKGGYCFEPRHFQPATGTFSSGLTPELCEPEVVDSRHEIVSHETDITACDSTTWRTRYAWRVDRFVKLAEHTYRSPSVCAP